MFNQRTQRTNGPLPVLPRTHQRHPSPVRGPPRFFVDGLPGVEVARRFGYTPGSFRVLVHQFRQSPRRDFFLTPAKGPHSAPKTDPLRDRIIALRKQNLSIYDISRTLAHEGHPLSPVAVAQILKDEGFARLPRRADDERPPARGRPRPMSPMSGNLT